MVYVKSTDHLPGGFSGSGGGPGAGGGASATTGGSQLDSPVATLA